MTTVRDCITTLIWFKEILNIYQYNFIISEVWYFHQYFLLTQTKLSGVLFQDQLLCVVILIVLIFKRSLVQLVVASL